MKTLKKIICREYEVKLDKTCIVGILNVTPDSFSDGGLFSDVNTAVDHAKTMVAQGADIIDIGGESSRPGSLAVSEKEELARVLPVIRHLVQELKTPISIDTYKPTVAKECLNEGVHLINDITGLHDPKMVKLAAEYNVPVVIMHMKGTPKIMQENPVYGDVVAEVKNFLKDRVALAHNAGVVDVIVDPGIGFGKTLKHNLEIIKRLGEFTDLGCPLLVGPSRKSFIGQLTGLSANDRIEGTLAAVAVSIMNGADIVRVHDVKECKRVVQVVDAIRGV
ncbi:MAG: dihydropteroate synthase [Euryarchaeota archaeon]|nr:dihydropteroate synthase [Euryarchaeota archaeon]